LIKVAPLALPQPVASGVNAGGLRLPRSRPTGITVRRQRPDPRALSAQTKQQVFPEFVRQKTSDHTSNRSIQRYFSQKGKNNLDITIKFIFRSCPLERVSGDFGSVAPGKERWGLLGRTKFSWPKDYTFVILGRV